MGHAAKLIKTSLERAAAGMLPIDFAHGLDDLGSKDGREAGWITAREVEGNRILATVEWTTAGTSALREKLYRVVSAVFYTGAKTGANTGDLMHIARAGLTNVPALPELKQVTSQDVSVDDPLRLVLASVLNLSATVPDADLDATLTSRP